MYPIILALHSAVRWVVLASLIFALFRAYTGWRSKRTFTPFDNSVRHWTATIVHIQFAIGLLLYFISPIVDYFLDNYPQTIHLRELRFFGLEHSLMMFIAVFVITVGSVKAKRRPTNSEKFKTMAVWFTIGLIIILTSIPWSFSPLVNRPNYRPIAAALG